MLSTSVVGFLSFNNCPAMIDKIFTSIPIATSNTSEHSGLPLRFSEVIIDLKKKNDQTRSNETREINLVNS